MKEILILLGLVILSSGISINNAFAVDFIDRTGYIPDWAKTIGQNQATSTCMTVDYNTKDFGWCAEFNGYVLDKLMGKVNEAIPPKEPPIQEKEEIKIPKIEKTSQLIKYFLGLNQVAYSWKISGDEHTVSEVQKQSSVLYTHARSYESSNGLDTFFVAITEFKDDTSAKKYASLFVESLKKQIPEHDILEGEW